MKISTVGLASALFGLLAHCSAPDPGLPRGLGQGGTQPPNNPPADTPDSGSGSQNDSGGGTLDASNDIVAAVQCTETGAVQANGHCYFTLETAVSWTDASAACKAKNSHLVTITSAAEQATVATVNPIAERWT